MVSVGNRLEESGGRVVLGLDSLAAAISGRDRLSEGCHVSPPHVSVSAAVLQRRSLSPRAGARARETHAD